MGPATILYDDECGVCRCSTDAILAWDRRDRLRAVALQDREADRLLRGMDHTRKMASWHLVLPDGRIHSAGAAAAPLLRLLPGGRPVAMMAEAFPRLTENVYGFVARHRSVIGRLLRADACRVRRRRHQHVV